MAFLHHRPSEQPSPDARSGDAKASSLHPVESDATENPRAHSRRTDPRKDFRKKPDGDPARRRVQVWVDILLILLLVGVVAGGIFGFNQFKKLYTPRYKLHTVMILVEFSDLEAAYLPKYWHMNAAAYISEGGMDRPIATLSDVPLVVVQETEDGASPDELRKTVRILLKAEAVYRPGEGYSVGEVPLWAGMIYNWSVDGIAAPAQILMVCPAEDYVPRAPETAAQTAPAAP